MNIRTGSQNVGPALEWTVDELEDIEKNHNNYDGDIDCGRGNPCNGLNTREDPESKRDDS